MSPTILTHGVHDLRTPLTSFLAGMQTMEVLGDINVDQRETLDICIQGGYQLLGMIDDLLDVGKMEEGSGVLELTDIAADVDKLTRALVNLLGNAIKFTPVAGRVTLMASRITAPPGAMLEFAVSDTGEGIPEEPFARIFDKFGQVESRKEGRTMSTGLGLTFCKMVAEAHSGEISVESALGSGTTFRIRLPV